MSEWKEYKLGEVTEVTSAKRIFYSEYMPTGVPFYRSKEIIDLYNNREVTTELFISEERFNEIEKKYGVPQVNDILITSVGSLGIPYIVKENDRFYFKDGNLTWIKSIDTNRLLPQYLKNWIISSIGKQKLDEITIGSTQPALTISGLKSMSLKLPPIEEQKRIAGVLSSLDDKIDLLNRENATLEALAETLFRHYFIENPNPTWKEGKVSDVSFQCKDSINPQKHSDKTFLHYSIPAYDNGQSPTEEQGQNIQSNKYVVPLNCILFSKLNPNRDKRVWLMQDDVQPNAICSTEFQIVKPQDDKWLYFLYGWLTYKENYDKIASGVSGTSGSHQRIDPKVIFDNECPIVDDETLAQYNEQVKPIFEKIKSNLKQMQTLSVQRATLLPRLISGEVKVCEH